MKIFITGTDTNIGKTVVSSWLSLHTGYDYVKPIQTGEIDQRDSIVVSQLSGSRIYPETFLLKAPVSPHEAARRENITIDLHQIRLPPSQNLIIEGAGGIFVPLNESALMIDLIKMLHVPVVVVARTRLGTINHTLLTLEALRAREIPVLGVVMVGEPNVSNEKAIRDYGNTNVLAILPWLAEVNPHALLNCPLSLELERMLGKTHENTE